MIDLQKLQTEIDAENAHMHAIVVRAVQDDDLVPTAALQLQYTTYERLGDILRAVSTGNR